MKVSNAFKIFSKTTAASLRCVAVVISGAFATATVAEYFNDNFDALNGPSGLRDVTPLRSNVTPNSDHVERWTKFRRDLQENIFFLKNGKRAKLPCVAGLIDTVTSYLVLRNVLFEKYNFIAINLRLLDQDDLENLFSILRALCSTYMNPTCSMFSANLKTAIVTRLSSLHKKGANCEEDNLKLLCDLRALLSAGPGDDEESTAAEDQHTEDDHTDDIDATADEAPVLHLPEEDLDFGDDLQRLLNCEEDDPEIVDDHRTENDIINLEDLSTSYVAGYIAKKVLRKVICVHCKTALTSEEILPEHRFIQEKEWKGGQKSLVYPSARLLSLIRTAVTVFDREIDAFVHEKNLKLKVLTLFHGQCDVSWFRCETHRSHTTSSVFNLLARLLLHVKCRRMNEALVEESGKGADVRQKQHFLGR